MNALTLIASMAGIAIAGTCFVTAWRGAGGNRILAADLTLIGTFAVIASIGALIATAPR